MKKLAPQVGLEPTTLRLTAWIAPIQSECHRVSLAANMLYRQGLWKRSNYFTVLYNATVCPSTLLSVGTKMGTVQSAEVGKSSPHGNGIDELERPRMKFWDLLVRVGDRSVVPGMAHSVGHRAINRDTRIITTMPRNTTQLFSHSINTLSSYCR